MAAVTDPRTLTKFAGLDIRPAEQPTKRGGVYIIYGQGGVGKTSAVADLVGSRFVERGAAWLNMDAGTDSIEHLIREGKIQDIRIEKWTELEKFTNAYVNEQPWDLVCLDNLSEGQSMDLNAIVGGVPRIVEIQEYGISQAHVLSLVRKWRNIADATGITVFILLWQREMFNERTKMTKHELYLTKQLAEAMGGVIGCVMHLTTENDRDVTRHLSLSGASSVTAAKFRRDKSNEVAWTIPNDIYFRKDQAPLIDLLATLHEGVPFPTAKYARRVRPDES